jgi:hypothetical protein
MKAGGNNMVLANIINISKEKIGIGRLILHTETGGLIIEKLQERVETMQYHITTQVWVLIGNHRNLRQLSISIVVLEEIL